MIVFVCDDYPTAPPEFGKAPENGMPWMHTRTKNSRDVRTVRRAGLAHLRKSDVVLEDFAQSILGHVLTRRRHTHHGSDEGQDASQTVDETKEAVRDRYFEEEEEEEGRGGTGEEEARGRQHTEESLKHTIERLRSTQNDLRNLMHRAHHLGRSFPKSFHVTQ